MICNLKNTPKMTANTLTFFVGVKKKIYKIEILTLIISHTFSN